MMSRDLDQPGQEGWDSDKLRLSRLQADPGRPFTSRFEVYKRDLSPTAYLVEFEAQSTALYVHMLVTELTTLQEKCFTPEVAFTAEDIKQLLFEGRYDVRTQGKFIGVIEDDKIVACLGFATYTSETNFNKRAINIETLATDPEYRRRGYAREMIQHVLEIASTSQSYTGVSLQVAESNSTAQALYIDQLGFKRSGEKKGYYEGGETALFLTLRTASQ